MTKAPAKDMAGQDATATGAGIAAQATALDVLLAEMRALATLLPGHTDAARSDAEIEMDFDNMPV